MAKAFDLPRRDLYARALALRGEIDAASAARGAPRPAPTAAGREVVCALWLMVKGYRLLGFRLRTPLGEIDLLGR